MDSGKTKNNGKGMELERKWEKKSELCIVRSSLVPRPHLPLKRAAWYRLFAHARKLPCLYGNRKIINIYPYIAMYTNRVLFVSHK